MDGGGNLCLPTGACAGNATYTQCHAHSDCPHATQVCCIVPGMGSDVCVEKAECPSGCYNDSDCGEGNECCKLPDNPAMCTAKGQCVTGAACGDGQAACPEGQECCDMMGQKMCMPAGQCMGGACAEDKDCTDGQKCCDLFGQKMCMPQCFM